jgi:hypothetical protein
MNEIKSHPVGELGYHFVDKKYLPAGKNEYYLREKQNPGKNRFRPLTTKEIDTLVNNRNTSDNWNRIMVSELFDANLVRNCKFFGLIRIGALQPLYHEYHNLRMPVGIYNSTIISCDLGDNVCIDNVTYLSHYIIGNQVMLANINELATTDQAKFGNGIVKDGEDEKTRVRIEVCNENGGRSIIPFDGMLAGDAYIWSKYRDDLSLLSKLMAFTDKKFDSKRGYYGKIGDRTIIKNCRIIKDTCIGSDAYIKGANKLKNITINSDDFRPSQIGEGCELVNGIVGFGCRIFYGVKAVRFIVASHSQLKYGARLINSYLGNNSTISCCEVLNSLIFPAHEQHHNNSFLCASLIMGQSNMAAGATIGSNHNSRSADGEIIAGRGFWPGLCVSLKHNSKFASYTIMAKGDYPAELNIPIPFCLVSNDVTHDRLTIMPAYWFLYNMYALERNGWKYKDRDKRTEKIQLIENDYLAPDTVNEIFHGLEILDSLKADEKDQAYTTGWENTKRPVLITKLNQSRKTYRDMLLLYGMETLVNFVISHEIKDFTALKRTASPEDSRSTWKNIGGQLIKTTEFDRLRKEIRQGKCKSWEEVHDFYREQGKKYEKDKLAHAFNTITEVRGISSRQFTSTLFCELLKEYVQIRERVFENIYSSRAKDYSNTFRKMVYDSTEEMNEVLGKFKDNSFIKSQQTWLEQQKKQVQQIIRKFRQ